MVLATAASADLLAHMLAFQAFPQHRPILDQPGDDARRGCSAAAQPADGAENAEQLRIALRKLEAKGTSIRRPRKRWRTIKRSMPCWPSSKQ